MFSAESGPDVAAALLSLSVPICVLSEEVSMFELDEPAINAMIDATNEGDSDALLAAFAEDAVLIDFGRTFAGKAQIARWNREENIGTQNRIRVTDVKRRGALISVEIVVSGNGYNGTGTLAFELRNDLIHRLEIAD